MNQHEKKSKPASKRPELRSEPKRIRMWDKDGNSIELLSTDHDNAVRNGYLDYDPRS